MTGTRGDALRQMNRAFADLDRVVAARTDSRRDAQPIFSVDDTEDALILRADLPGFAASDLEITVDSKSLTLRGERELTAPEGYEPRRRERRSVRFERSWTLPERIESDGVEASLESGVLRLRLPKAAEEKPRTIHVLSR